MDTNLFWQYAAVLLIVIAALFRIIIGLRKKHRRKAGGSCTGCSLSEACHDFKDSTHKASKRSEITQAKRDCFK